MFEFPVLVGDIGGTNARFAVVPEAGAKPILLSHEATAGHPDPSAAIRASLAQGDGPAPRSAILAVAARVDGPAVQLTNAHWVIEGARLVLGPGTGFGAAALLPVGKRLVIVSTEAGHTDFGPSNAAEHALWPHLERVEGRVTVETLLSGPGLTRLHGGLHRLRTGTDGPRRDPASVTEAGLSGTDPDAAASLNLFAKLLGRVCGDLALTFLATGGVYIGGGIAPRIIDVLQRGAFREAFERKPPFIAQMQVIPTSVIAVHDPALTGLAALASQPDLFDYHGQVWQPD